MFNVAPFASGHIGPGRETLKSANFEYLRKDWPELAELGGFAEIYTHPDRTGSLVKLRNFAEQVVEYLYYRHGLTKLYQPNLMEVINIKRMRDSGEYTRLAVGIYLVPGISLLLQGAWMIG